MLSKLPPKWILVTSGVTIFFALLFWEIILTQAKPISKNSQEVSLPQVLSATPAVPTLSILAPKANQPACCKKEYPYTYPQPLTDGVTGSDNPADPAWVKFSQDNVKPYFFSVNGYLRVQRPLLVQAMEEMGAKTHRAEYNWADLEKSKGVYDWSYLDSRTQQALQNGIQPYFLISRTPTWAQSTPDPSKPPDNPADYANFVAAFIKHLNAAFPNQTTRVIEVWNEINEQFWTGTEEEYLKMLQITYQTAKAVDSSWQIMAETFSGMQLPEFNYLYSFKDQNGDSILKKYSDLIAVHPYGGILSPDDPVSQENGWGSFSLLADNTQRVNDNKIPGSSWAWCCFKIIAEDDPSSSILRSWRQVMIRNNDGDKKVWLTEMGWHRTMFDGSNSKWPYPPDDKRVAELITRLLLKSAEYDFVDNVTVYDFWADPTANLVDPSQSYAKTKAYYVFQNLATTDGIIIDLAKSPTDAYPTAQFNIRNVNLGTLNYTQNGQRINRIKQIDVSISTDNITYTNAGQIINNGPETGKVSLALDNINQTGRWIKLQITPEPGTSDYFIDEVEVNIPSPTSTAVLSAYFSLQSGTTFPQGTQIPVKIMAETNTDYANTFVGKINFPADLLSVSRIDTAGSFVTNWTENYYDNALGTISLVGGVPNPGYKTSGSPSLIATIYFTSKASGTANLAFDPASVIYRNLDNANILAKATGMSITVSPTASPLPVPTPSPTPTPIPTSTPTPTPLPAPLNLTATASSYKQVNLSWQSSSSSISTYWIIRDNVTIAQTTAESYSDTSVLPSTTYSYQVVATDKSGTNSDPSNIAAITTPTVPDTTPPTAPVNVEAIAVTSSQINLSWSPSTDNIGVTAYDIYQNDTLLTSVSGKTLSFGATGLNPATAYHYSIIARDAPGNSSGISNTAKATTLALVTPTPTPMPIKGDFSRDDVINLLDHSILLSNWGKAKANFTPIDVDLNSDGVLNVFDFAILKQILIDNKVIRIML